MLIGNNGFYGILPETKKKQIIIKMTSTILNSSNKINDFDNVSCALYIYFFFSISYILFY